MMMIMMTRRIIGPLLIRPARTHGSPVRTGRTHGPDGEKALHDKLFRASGPSFSVNSSIGIRANSSLL